MFRNKWAYFIPVILFFLTGIAFLSLYDKELIHITQNGWHNPFFDHFFALVTLLGDGYAYIVPALILPFVKCRWFIGLVINALLVLLLVGFFKQVVFGDTVRPVKYFENKLELRLVEGVKVHHARSFPSGHTTMAFGLFGFLALLARPAWGQILCFITAACIGYSRIYLSQHFLEDVIAGTALGTLIAIISYLIMKRLHSHWMEKRLM